MASNKRVGIDIGTKAKDLFCGYNPIGNTAEFFCRGSQIELEPDGGKNTVTTYCWCCTFWRGVAVGGVLGLIVGALL